MEMSRLEALENYLSQLLLTVGHITNAMVNPNN